MYREINRCTLFDINRGHTITGRRKPDVFPHIEILAYNIHIITSGQHSIICRKENKKE